MPYNAIDWVVSSASWTQFVPETFPAGTGAVSSMTLPRSIATGVTGGPTNLRFVVAAPEFSDEWTCIRVVGSTHFQLDVPAVGFTWKAILDARIEILDSDPPTGIPLVPILGFDMTDPIDANRSFMDHKSQMFFRDATWTDIAIHQAPYSGRFDWDVKVKRKLDSSEVVAMIIQWSNLEGSVSQTPDLRVIHRIRMLASFNE